LLHEGQGDTADVKSQRFASVWDAIEDDPAEAEKMKQWSALRMRADTMAALLCVQPVPRQATADELQHWIDWRHPSYEAAQRQTGTIGGLIYAIDGKAKLETPLSIEDINAIAVATSI
jgi:hypothetical protein